jgi:Icc-related predicted phosphoesterase
MGTYLDEDEIENLMESGDSRNDVSIVHLSDTHTNLDIEIPDCDILIHTGDFCKLEKFDISDQDATFAQAMEFLDWYSKRPGKHKLLLAGNHEAFLNNLSYLRTFREECKSLNILFLEDELVEIEGLKIYGASNSFPHVSPDHFQGYYFKENFWDKLPSNHIDILLTHVTPEMSSKQNYGCPELAKALQERTDIKYVLCGHSHEDKGRYDYHNTVVLNSSCETKPTAIILVKVLTENESDRLLDEYIEMVTNEGSKVEGYVKIKSRLIKRGKND